MTRARILLLIVIVLGLAAAAASLTIPVETGYGDDPILNLDGLDPTVEPPAPGSDKVVCEAADQSASQPVTFDALARERACREASTQRVASAVAWVALLAVVVLAALLAFTGRLGRL